MLAPRRMPGSGATARDPRAVPPRPAADNPETVRGLQAEIAFIHESIARNKRELAALIGDGQERSFARAGEELTAAVEAMRGATEKILGLAEIADDSARTLAASIKDDYKRGLAQDIQEQIIKIFEACNFQDLAGQHIGKVARMLNATEQQLGVVLARCSGVHAATQPLGAAGPAQDDGLLNGPRLPKDSGHATQHDIDRMFA